MRPKKHFIAAEIKEEGLVFASESYDCKVAGNKLMDTSMALDSPGLKSDQPGVAKDLA